MTIEQALASAMQHHQQGRLAEAEALYRQVIALNPKQADAIHLLGVVALQVGKAEAALELIRKAVEISPGVAQFHCNLGQALERLGRSHEAIQSFRDAILIRPDYPDANYNLGTILDKCGNSREAIEPLQRSIAARPNHAGAHNNLGNAYQSMDRLEEAIASFEQALRCKPDYVEAANNLGNAHLMNGQIEAGQVWLRRAIAMKSDHASAHFNLGISLLLTGDLQEGWPEYEWRWKTPELAASLPNVPQPRWTGQDLQGKTILIYPEQGFGDLIQFSRYVPLLADRGARVILICQPQLLRLLGGIQGVSEIIPTGSQPPPFDFHSPLLNLPGSFKTTLATIPAGIPYLNADPKISSRWRARISADWLRVGLVWAGAAGHRNDRNRSIAPELLAPLGEIADVSWFSLQQDARAKPNFSMTDWTGEFQDFADTAALMDNLDLVISVDTAVAHLAGAMGKPVWVMLPFAADWRWMLGRTDSPWYPTMRLFRQPAIGDWNSVIYQVGEALREFKK